MATTMTPKRVLIVRSSISMAKTWTHILIGRGAFYRLYHEYQHSCHPDCTVYALVSGRTPGSLSVSATPLGCHAERSVGISAPCDAIPGSRDPSLSLRRTRV